MQVRLLYYPRCTCGQVLPVGIPLSVTPPLDLVEPPVPGTLLTFQYPHDAAISQYIVVTSVERDHVITVVISNA